VQYMLYKAGDATRLIMVLQFSGCMGCSWYAGLLEAMGTVSFDGSVWLEGSGSIFEAAAEVVDVTSSKGVFE